MNGGSFNNTSGAAITIPNAMNWNGNFTFVGSNSITVSSTQIVTLTGNTVLTINGAVYTAEGNPPAGAIILGQNSTSPLVGMITGSPTTNSLSITGTGTLMLQNGTGTYTGGTTIGSTTGTITVVLGNYSDTLDVLNVNALGSGTITLNAGGVLWAQPANVAPYKNNTYNFTDNMVFNGGTFNGQDGLQHLGTGALRSQSAVRTTVRPPARSRGIGATSLYISMASCKARATCCWRKVLPLLRRRPLSRPSQD